MSTTASTTAIDTSLFDKYYNIILQNATDILKKDEIKNKLEEQYKYFVKLLFKQFKHYIILFFAILFLIFVLLLCILMLLLIYILPPLHISLPTLPTPSFISLNGYST